MPSSIYKSWDDTTGKLPNSVCAPEEVRTILDQINTGEIKPLTSNNVKIDGNAMWAEAPFTSAASIWTAAAAASPAPVNPRTLDYIGELGTGITPPSAGSDPSFSVANQQLFDLMTRGDGDIAPVFNASAALAMRETNLKKGGFREALCSCSSCFDLVAVAIEFEQPFNYPQQGAVQQGARELRTDVDLALNALEREIADDLALYIFANTQGVSWSVDDEANAPRYRIGTFRDFLLASGGAKFLGREPGPTMLRNVLVLCRPVRFCRPCSTATDLSFRMAPFQLQKSTLINPGLTPPYPTVADTFRTSYRIQLFGRETAKNTCDQLQLV